MKLNPGETAIVSEGLICGHPQHILLKRFPEFGRASQNRLGPFCRLVMR